MARLLDAYEPIVGENVIEELHLLASHLEGASVQHVNATAVGGGVAEILNRLVPLLKDLGLKTRWDVIHGGERFFWVTKKIHDALRGTPIDFTKDMMEIFLETSNLNNRELACTDDFVIIHDPEPIALVEQRKSLKNKWIWRCHRDVSHPHEQVWKFLASYIPHYNAAVFSAPQFSHLLNLRQVMIMPSIDPLSEKNKELPESTIASVLQRFGITHEKPMITQISRFDFLKDPIGVIEAYQIVKRSIDCQLILAGGTMTDDPESDVVLRAVRERAGNDPDIHLLTIPPGSDIEINALQRASDVIIQKSLKEGFGLTVTEALWKGKPVVAGAVGGIPLQIKHRYSGMLCHSVEGAAHALKQILTSPEFAQYLGENGRDHVRGRFLLTRHLKDYLLLLLSLDKEGDIIRLS